MSESKITMTGMKNWSLEERYRPISIKFPLTIAYYRVSMDAQSEEMQIAAAHSYMKRSGITEYLEFNDHGVTATKLAIPERPELSRLIDLIKSGKVKRLIVYSRDRLARNAYEYVELLDLFYEYEVDVIFTGTNSFPFSLDRGIEMLLAIFSAYEGAMIGTRISDLNMQFPPRIYGYIKEKNEKEVKYSINPETQENILQLFSDAAVIENSTQFIEMIFRYEKKLKKDTKKILSILNNPFYAAYYGKEETGFHPLPHVEPIIKLVLFQEVRKKVKKYRNEVLKKLASSHLAVPICQQCKKPMKLIGKSIVENGRFHCSNGHQRIWINLDHFNELTKDTIHSFIKGICSEKIKTMTLPSIRKLINLNEQKEKMVTQDIEKLAQLTSLSFNPMEPTYLLSTKFEVLNELKEKADSLKVSRFEYQRVLNEASDLYSLITEGLQSKLETYQLQMLARYLIKFVQINANDTIHYEFYFGEFIKEEI